MTVVLLLLLAQFDYDMREPLSAEVSPPEVIEDGRLHEASFTSPRGGRVSAYLITPADEGPHAGIVFVHWGQGNRSEFVSEALVYAKAGAVSLLIDAPHMRSDFRGSRGGFEDPAGERDTYVQLVVDIRRAIDVLVAREDVDAKRIGYVGHSLGATWGGAVAGVDKRVRTFVLMGGLPNIVDPETSYPERMWEQIRTAYDEEQLRAYRRVVGAISPERFVGDAAPGIVFFQFARYDRFISEPAARAFVAAAREPEVRWYASSHELNDLASLRDRALWLQEKLELAPVLPLLRSRLAP